ncbi:MAG: PilZ domain-containing protein [Pseudomonadota bacterium]
MEKEKRYKIRKDSNVPIFYVKDLDDSYYQAIMHNMSTDGMYFESNHMFSPKEYFFIKTKEPIPGFEPAKRYNACAAQVKWCKKADADSHYKIGAKWTDKANIVKNGDVGISNLCCDLCANTSIQEVVKTEEDLSLCLNCFICLSQLPPKVLRGSLINFMVGNVI